METDTLVKPPTFRANMKQNAKGQWYGEGTVTAESEDELEERLNILQEQIKKRSTVGGDEK